MTSRSSSQQIQLELRLVGAADDKSWGLFQTPGLAPVKILRTQEGLGDWVNAKIGDMVMVRIPQSMAEGKGLYTLGSVVGSSKITPKNG
jgi:hypothetical protein